MQDIHPITIDNDFSIILKPVITFSCAVSSCRTWCCVVGACRTIGSHRTYISCSTVSWRRCRCSLEAEISLLTTACWCRQSGSLAVLSRSTWGTFACRLDSRPRIEGASRAGVRRGVVGPLRAVVARDTDLWVLDTVGTECVVL